MTAPSVLVNELPVDDSGSESDRYVVAPAGDHLVRSWRARASVEVVVDAIVAVSSTAAVYNESAVVSYDNIVATASSDAAAFSMVRELATGWLPVGACMPIAFFPRGSSTVALATFTATGFCFFCI